MATRRNQTAPAPAPAKKRARAVVADVTTETKAPEVKTTSEAEVEVRARTALLDNGESQIVPTPDAAATMSNLLKEPEVMVTVPVAFKLTLDDGRPISIQTGVQRMPVSMADHWYSKAMKVERFKAPSALAGQE